MKYNFCKHKDAYLKAHRGISFEEIIVILENEGPLDVINHPSDKYAHQKINVVEIDSYIYLVPFVESENEMFLKTIYKSRKATKFYLGEE